MKKYLIPALALGLVMTSCQSDEPFAPGEGGEKQVTFTLNVPGELGTRAAAGLNQSDKGGATNQGADQIKYTLVLQANNDTQILNHDQATVSGTTATFKPTVVLGREYTITAYASLKDAWNGVNPIAITNSFNDESKDAYFKTLKHNFANGDLQPLTLTRPFGKLRLVAEDYDPAKTKVESVTITYANPQEGTFNATTEAFTIATENVAGTTKPFGYYEAADATGAHTVFAEYLPAPKEGEYAVTFTAEVKYYGSDETYSRKFNDIPVRRNALTTLSGNFFTANSEIKVEVKDAFEGQIPGNDEEQLAIAAAMGGEYTLEGDIVLSKPLNITNNMTLNLNGKTITAANAKGNGAAIEVAEGVSAKLMGGTIKNTTPNGDAAINNAGELVLDDISIEGAPIADGGYPNYAVYTSGKLVVEEGTTITSDRGALYMSNGADVTINGGNISVTDALGSRVLTAHVIYAYGSTSKLTINDGNFALNYNAAGGLGASVICPAGATIKVFDGDFRYYGVQGGQSGIFQNYMGYGAPVDVYGGTFNDNTVTKSGNIADGYEAVEKDGLYYVLTTSVSTANQLCQTLSVMAITGSTEEIKLTDNINLSGVEWSQIGTSEKPFAGTLNGNGKKISNLSIDNTDYAALIAYTAENAQIKNLILENVNIQSNKHAAGVVCVAGEGLTIENVKVSGVITAVSYAGGIVHNAANVTIKNCENNAKVSANRAGGIASWVTVGANIENVINTGDITGEVGASGIAHGFAGSIKNAVNRGDIKSNYFEAAAGIAGVQKAASTYEYCYNYGNVTSIYDDANASAAGILGQSPGSASTLKYCANYGNITAVASYAAGIAYSLYGTINASYCYNEGVVNGADGAGAIAPKAQYGAGDKASYCLNAGTITSSNGIVYQGSNNNTSCYYYDGNVLKSVSGNTEVFTEDAMTVLNGGADTEFFRVENGKICVK